MHAPVIELALSKAASAAEASALQPVLRAAAHLDQTEAAFEHRINASKAARGEKPTVLSARRQAAIDAYASDAKELEAQQLRELALLDSAAAILAVLRPALDQDVKFWARAHEKAHAGDVALVQDFAAAKAGFRDAVRTFLSARHVGAS